MKKSLKAIKSITDYTRDEILKQRIHDWELNRESERLGLISDDEKIRLLKQELFEQSRLYPREERTQRLEYLRDAIDCLEAVRNAEFQRKYDVRKWIDDLVWLTFLGGLTVLIGAYIASYNCGNSRSQFCASARVISTQVDHFFKD